MQVYSLALLSSNYLNDYDVGGHPICALNKRLLQVSV